MFDVVSIVSREVSGCYVAFFCNRTVIVYTKLTTVCERVHVEGILHMKSSAFDGKADDVAMYPLKNSGLDVSTCLDVIDDVSCYHV